MPSRDLHDGRRPCRVRERRLERVDAIVCATGYRLDIPFLPDELWAALGGNPAAPCTRTFLVFVGQVALQGRGPVWLLIPTVEAHTMPAVLLPETAGVTRPPRYAGDAATHNDRSPARTTVGGVHEIGQRRRNQPAPPHIIFEALTDLERAGARPWLELLDDEQRPQVLQASAPGAVVWSSIWIGRPDAVIEFDLLAAGGGSTDLRWTVSVDDPPPDDALVGHMRKRMNVLINANLRYSFGG